MAAERLRSIVGRLWNSAGPRQASRRARPTSPRLRHRLAVGSQVRGADGHMYRVRGIASSIAGARYYAERDDGYFVWLLADAIRELVEGAFFPAEPQPACAPEADGRPSDCPASDWVSAPEGSVTADVPFEAADLELVPDLSADSGGCGDTGGGSSD